MKVEVKVRVTYKYRPEEREPFVAEVALYIPQGKGGIVEDLVSREHEVLGQTLFPFWGYEARNGRERYRDKVVQGSSWAEVTDKALVVVKEIEAILKTVAERNRKMKAEMPRDLQITLSI